jgi:hypothetical protein
MRLRQISSRRSTLREFPHLGDTVARGIFLDRDEGTIYSARESTMVFKALHETTGGAFSFMERDLPVGNRRPQPHTHAGPEAFTCWKGRLNSSSGEKVEKEGADFGHWHQVPCRTHSAMLVTLPRDY